MPIHNETRYGKAHEWAVGCYTCAENEFDTVFWRRVAGFEVDLEANVVAKRHDQLFDHEHDVVIYEYKPESRIC